MVGGGEVSWGSSHCWKARQLCTSACLAVRKGPVRSTGRTMHLGISCVLFLLILGVSLAIQLDHQLHLDFQPMNNGTGLILQVTGATTGYIGIGFSLGGNPISDLVMLWVDDLTGLGHLVVSKTFLML